MYNEKVRETFHFQWCRFRGWLVEESGLWSVRRDTSIVDKSKEVTAARRVRSVPRAPRALLDWLRLPVASWRKKLRWIRNEGIAGNVDLSKSNINLI